RLSAFGFRLSAFGFRLSAFGFRLSALQQLNTVTITEQAIYHFITSLHWVFAAKNRFTSPSPHLTQI
ncbi:MAG: hypothetical protein ACSHW0_18595, partial [Thalassotalea sp.]